MLEKINSGTSFTYIKVSKQEQATRHILGRLAGVIADYKNPTRNERKYTEKLWDKVFADPIVQEQIKNRCMYGELGHPEERTEIDIEKIAICLAEQPKKSNDGKLYGVFDILDTPNGRILKTMCDYGCTIGVQSRGTGDTITNYLGQEEVDPETYSLMCWDAVLLPACISARVKLVNESFDTQTVALKNKLYEQYDNASEKEKQIIKESLSILKDDQIIPNQIKSQIEQKVVSDNFHTLGESVNINNAEIVQNAINMATDNVGALIKQLQEALQQNTQQEQKIKSLQEKLSICYAKETQNVDKLSNVTSDLNKQKQLIEKLNNEKTLLQNKVIEARENNKKQKQVIEELTSTLNNQNSANVNLTESVTTVKKLLESKNSEITKLKEEIKTTTQQNSQAQTKLQESFEEYKKDSLIEHNNLQNKINKQTQLIEKYKNVAKVAVDKYIASQAKLLGVQPTDIKDKLSENYSFNDIDRVCENLKSYSINVHKLPFNLTEGTYCVKAKSTPDKLVSRYTTDLDDTVDDSLLAIAGLK